MTEKEEIIERLDCQNWYNVSIETLRFIDCIIELDLLPEPDDFVLYKNLPDNIKKFVERSGLFGIDAQTGYVRYQDELVSEDKLYEIYINHI